MKPAIHEIDPIIDKSPEQKILRLEKLRLELSELGYSILPTEWLQALDVMMKRGRAA